MPNLPAMQETQVPFLGKEDPLEGDRLPTPVFWSGELHGLYSPWGRKESYTTEPFSLSIQFNSVQSLSRLRLFATP